MELKYDFSGWGTRNDIVCADGRVIRHNAFAHCDGNSVPIVWNHQHNDPANILGHAILENRTDGVYVYGVFNDTQSGRAAKQLVQHGDVTSLSIYANDLEQRPNGRSKDVVHGTIREVSLVVAGANPGAFIDFVDLAHGEGGEQEVIIGSGEEISLFHADEKPPLNVIRKTEEKGKAEEDGEGGEKKTPKPAKEKTVKDVVDTMTEEQKTVMYALIGAAMEQKAKDEGDEGDEGDEEKSGRAAKTKGGDKTMKHNVFDNENTREDNVLSHADRQEIISLAKQNSVGSLRMAMNIYAEQAASEGDDALCHSIEALQHGYDNIEALFPDYRDLKPGAPERISRDQGWVGTVMKKVHKSPISRIRTRNLDARGKDVRAKGYQKGDKKTPSGNMALISRTTDPQTVYCTDALNRDDIVDITDFDVVEYQYGVMRETLNEELAMAIMVGDGREEGEEMKISESHIRSIWNDDDLYTIHYDVDVEAARGELNGSATGEHFGDNFVYAEAIVAAALYSREKYKGTGTPDLFCTPHLVNIMLLARDRNGRRIYSSREELAAALNVSGIHTAEQFEGLIRTDKAGAKHKLLGLFVNLADYTVGSTKGGEITRFDQFDIDFNRQKYLIEARLSGALTRLWSAIALEEPVK